MERGRDKFRKVRPLLNIMAGFYSAFPLKVRKKLLEHHRKTTGLKGIAIRYALLKTIARKCGENVSIHPNCFLLCPEKLEIGNNVSIQPMCYLDATGEIFIGDDVSIAHGVTVMSTEHKFDDLQTPIKDQGIVSARTVIEDNVWIGAKATVLSGNVIHSGAIVGAGAVVTRIIPENVIVAGVPATILSYR